jgi:hypothetical protein
MFGRSRLWFLLKLFFLLIFKDGPLENFDRFLKIALPFICLNTSVWARWKGISKSKIRKIKKPTTTIFLDFFFVIANKDNKLDALLEAFIYAMLLGDSRPRANEKLKLINLKNHTKLISFVDKTGFIKFSCFSFYIN